MKKILTLLLVSSMLFVSNVTFAQEEVEEGPISLGADLVSRYVWRGMQLSGSPAIQPHIDCTLGNITFGTWVSQ